MGVGVGVGAGGVGVNVGGGTVGVGVTSKPEVSNCPQTVVPTWALWYVLV